MVRFNRYDETGNIFWIMGRAIKELEHNGQKRDAEVMCERVTDSGSYDEALKIIGEYVELKEIKYAEV